MRKALETLVVFLAFLILGYFYLAPNSGLALLGDTTHLISEGGDASTAPFQYHVVLETARRYPTRLLFGTLFTPQLNAPYGLGLWVPMFERLSVVLLSPFFTLEGLATAFVWMSMTMNGLVLYWLGRRRGWPFAIALALGICWAFNPYTRARSISHFALVGIFYLPSAFLGLDLLRNAKRKREWALASSVLLFTVFCAHYYVMVLAILSPFLIFYFWRGMPKTPGTLGRLVVGGLPAVLFLGWSLLAPFPFDLPAPPALQKPPITPEWLDIYGARPIDYFTGDMAFGSLDWNPLRRAATQAVREKGFEGSNNLERSNGIRWSILLIFAVATIAIVTPRLRKRLEPTVRSDVAFFSVFALGAFLLSMRPAFFSGTGPALWVHYALEHFRVPSRFGPAVHFSLLMIAGTLLTQVWHRLPGRRARIAVGAFLPILVFIDFPPLHPTWADEAPAGRTELILQATGHCGAGMYFPYLAVKPGNVEEFQFYKAIQSMKRTPCQLMGEVADGDLNQRLHRTFGTEVFESAQENVSRRETEFLKCSGLEWVVFRAQVSLNSRAQICSTLGWVRTAADSCRNPEASSHPLDVAGCL